MADISKLRFDGTDYNVKDASAPARPLGNGYSKTGTLPISSTDTISEAIGKLENNIGSGGGAVDSVSVGGGTPYTPDANGNIDLPAYPTPNTYTGSGAISVNSSTNVISHSTSAGYKHIPSGGSAGQFLKYSSSGTASWQSLPYGSESTQGAVRVWVTTVGSDTVLHISNQAAT